MNNVAIAPLAASASAIEVVERKGIGHPDTICDALAETLSRNLCREYRRRFGAVMHHNVDKALLVGGRSEPAFGGGRVVAPIRIYLAGRATLEFAGKSLALTEIAVEGSRAWLRENLHALDADRHVALETVIQPGSTELQSVFTRARDTAPLANDTSIGVGYAPMSALERLVLAIERRIGGRDQGAAHPARGEDIKVMAVGNGDTVDLSIACAMIGGHLAGMSDYLHQKFELEQLARQLAQEHGFAVAGIAVNAADHPASGSIYLTVTGTSAEAGDDGQVGRGNRVNGLITPMRPMSLEAAAGKNPISHTGKLYNVVACRIAERLVAELAEVAAAECYLVSRIGVPVTSPSVVYLRLQTRDDIPLDAVQPKAAEIAHDQLGRIRRLVDDFVEGTLDLY